MIDKNPDLYLRQIQDMLIKGTYHISQDDYIVEERFDKTKVRKIQKLNYYPHRIIQWAIMLQVEDRFVKNFTTSTCASLKERGTTYCASLIKKYLQEHSLETKYCLKIDIKHFYQNIDHDILKKKLRTIFKDKQLLDLLDMIIDSCEEGVPIGSYLSQYFANFYLSSFDHWLKENLHIKYVTRYMDDVVIFGDAKEELHKILNQIIVYLDKNLNLELKDNYQIFESRKRGIDYVGYRFFGDYTLLRKMTAKNLKKKMNRISKKTLNEITYTDYCCFNSYKGYLKWCNGFNLYKRYMVPLEPIMNQFYLTEVIHD